MKKLAIITTHPIQYYAPVFQLLHQHNRISIMVFYTWGELSVKKHDPGFNKNIEWDIPLLNGYPFQWVKNVAKHAGTHHTNGIINPGLIDQLKQWQPDVLLVYGWGFKSHLKAIRYFKNKIPVLFRGDSTLLDNSPGTRSLIKLLYLKWLYRHVDHGFYPGTNTEAYFKKYGLTDTQLHFAPHAVDNNRFGEDRGREVQALKQKLGIEDNQILVLFAGKFEKKKSPEYLLNAFTTLNAKGAHLLFVGNGPLERHLKFMAQSNRNISFLDFQNQTQMPVIYQVCDIFCLPSNGPGETWGLAINEAMASGKAVLASDKAGAAIDLVQPGCNGGIFKGGDLHNLTSELGKLIGIGKAALAKMGQESQRMIRDWTFENQVKVIEDVVING